MAMHQATEYSEHPERPARMTQIVDLATGQALSRASELTADSTRSGSTSRSTGMSRGPRRGGAHGSHDDLLGRLDQARPQAEDRAELLLMHAGVTPEYIKNTEHYYMRKSLYVNEHSSMAARVSCGAVIEMSVAVATGRVRNGFAVVRPPGHHAEPDEAMGFCFLNNVAVAAEVMLRRGDELGVKRIMILDWDIHHGNGTQTAFESNPNVLYVSLHRYDRGQFYPGSRAAGPDQVGVGAGIGRNVNIAWDLLPDDELEMSIGDADYMYAFQRVVMPIAYEFAPDIVLVSAGFDAARGDPLGGCDVTPAGFAHMTHSLMSLAKGKLVLALEGGYNVDSVANSAVACIQALLGDPVPWIDATEVSDAAIEAVEQTLRAHSPHWKRLKPVMVDGDELQKRAATLSLDQVLKMHRSYYVWEQYQLIDIPLTERVQPADSDLEPLFSHQVFASADVYEASTLVLFCHDMWDADRKHSDGRRGTLHVQLAAQEADAIAHRSLLLDQSKLVLEWVADREHAIVDVNVLAKPANQPYAHKEAAAHQRLACYVWDNIVQLADASRIVLIGQGLGCAALASIVNTRAVRDRVVCVVMFPGTRRPPEIVGKDRVAGLRQWYDEVRTLRPRILMLQHSQVWCPSSHELVNEQSLQKRRFGRVHDAGVYDPLHVMQRAWSRAERHLDSLLTPLQDDLVPDIVGM